MAIDNFIPQIWANRILENLNAAHVFADRLNRDYEGDIRAHGDSVRINSIGRVTISDTLRMARSQHLKPYKVQIWFWKLRKLNTSISRLTI